MNRMIFFPHGGSGNHGCEAIVRTTSELFNDSFNIQLFSDSIEEDRFYLGDGVVDILSPRKKINRFSKDYFFALLKYRFRHENKAFDELAFLPIISEMGSDVVLMSIGGDNYCYGENEFIYMINRCAKRKNSKTVLWGCSVEPSGVSGDMAKDLESYDLIVARESITYGFLKQINSNTVLLPDPAFGLKRELGFFPDRLKSKSYIGINISPLIQTRESVPGITMANYCQLIEHILSSTDDNIALIPHVVWNHNDDRVPLQTIFDKYIDTGRIFMIKDQNCCKLKDIIAGCRMFVGARTHATIAAYSSSVPTLTIGYSVKARGIARDLFGTDENFVLPVQRLSSENDITSAFKWLSDNEYEIRCGLKSLMECYPERILEAKRLIKDLAL